MVDFVCPRGQFRYHSCSPKAKPSDVICRFAIMLGGNVVRTTQRIGIINNDGRRLDGMNPCQHAQLNGTFMTQDPAHWRRDVIPNGNVAPFGSYTLFDDSGKTLGTRLSPVWRGTSQSITGRSPIVHGKGVSSSGSDSYSRYCDYSISIEFVGNSIRCSSQYQMHWNWAEAGRIDNPTRYSNVAGTVIEERRIQWDDGRLTSGTSAGTFDTQASRVFVQPSDLWHYMPAPMVEWGDLSSSCVSKCKTNDINMISYCKEIPGIGDMVRDTLKCITNLDSPKSWADLFLSAKYGWNMSYQDTRALCTVLRDNCLTANSSQRVVRASSSVPDAQCGAIAHLQIKYDVNSTPESQFKKVLDSGFWPTAENLWDLVPFSFVVNWLTGMDGITTAIDNRVYLATMPIVSVCRSLKCESPFPMSASPTGWDNVGVSLTTYSREVSETPPLPRVQLSAAGPSRALDHSVELTALVAQKIL